MEKDGSSILVNTSIPLFLDSVDYAPHEEGTWKYLYNLS